MRHSAHLLLLVLLINLCNTQAAQAQNGWAGLLTPSKQFNPQRATGLFLAEGSMVTASFVSLNVLWYKKYRSSRFHWFNDWPEWLQMDKCGHATVAYNLTTIGNGLYRWAGYSPAQANLVSSLTSLAIMGTIEIFDGYSEKWGFSWGDMGANFTGIGLAAAQFSAYNDQRIQLQFSFHYSPYRMQRPDELGENRLQSILKDYNGQSYWASINVPAFLKTNTPVPPWLCLAVGYGADGMTSGRPDELHTDTQRQRYFFLSLDAKLQNLLPEAPFSQTVATALSMLKVPAPALRYKPADKTIHFYPLYH